MVKRIPKPLTVRVTNGNGLLRPFEWIVDDILNLAVLHCKGKKTEAAKQLKMARSTLYKKLKDGA